VAAILKLSWQPGRVYEKSLRPTRSWGEGEKPVTDLASFTRGTDKVSKIYFFQATIHFSIFNAIISEFAVSLAQILWLKSSHNPEVKMIVRSQLTKISRAE